MEGLFHKSIMEKSDLKNFSLEELESFIAGCGK